MWLQTNYRGYDWIQWIQGRLYYMLMGTRGYKWIQWIQSLLSCIYMVTSVCMRIQAIYYNGYQWLQWLQGGLDCMLIGTSGYGYTVYWVVFIWLRMFA